MGKCEKYSPSSINRFLLSGVMELPNGRQDLQNILENTAERVDRRVLAGSALAIIGDHRIDAINPPMITILSSVTRVSVGADESSLTSEFDQLSSLGVRREWLEKECPRHTVELQPYRLGKYPITNMEYAKFLSDTGFEHIPSSWIYGDYPPSLGNHPVYSIPVDAAQRYCQWLAKNTGRRFRLPSEEEWEFAAAGPDGTLYPWGSCYISDRANTAEEALFGTSPVGAFPSGRTGLGCLDMAGNVEELTSSTYLPYPGGKSINDDLAKTLGIYQVARGGSFTRFRDLARCTRRHGPLEDALYPIGFRIAEEPVATQLDKPA